MGRKRKAFVHIGLARSDAGLLEPALAEHAAALEARGLRNPAASPEEMFRAAVEIRRDHRAWGYRRREVEGTWAEICRRAHKGRDDVIVSQQRLAAANPAQIALLLDGLAGFEVHVVVTARDLGSQLLAAWGAGVEAGRSTSFSRFCSRVMDPDRRHEQAQRFWAAQDLGTVLERWRGAVRAPDRVHVVVVPPTLEAARDTVWRAVGEVTGVATADLPLDEHPAAAPDVVGLAVLRMVNQAVDGRLPAHAHAEVVRRYLSDGSRADTAAPALPAERRQDLLSVGERWRKELADGGYDVHGDSTWLLPGRSEPGAPAPDQVPAEERLATATSALADVLVEVTRLREHNQALEQRNAKLERKRRKLKRKVAALG